MSKLVIHAQKGLVDLTPERAHWKRLGFRVVHLRSGADVSFDTSDREICVVVLAGACDVRANDERWTAVGERRSVFDGPPAAVYLPPRMLTVAKARASGVELAIASAPATRGARPRVLPPEDVRVEIVGSGATERRVHHILMEDQEAETLLVSEVIALGGRWSSYPPRKHDENDPPRETALEETNYHRLKDTRGFAVQRVYTADRALDETITVRDGDIVLVPRGFHTISAAPGYDLYTLNAMAGPVRKGCVTYDADHAWLRA